jgi:hypothetical protein
MAGFTGTKKVKIPNVATAGSATPSFPKAKMPSMAPSTKPAKPPHMPGVKGTVGRKLGNHYPNT